MVIELDATLFTITYFQHVKPGKGGAFVRTKLKNVLTGAVLDKTFRAGERVTEVRLERRPIQYSYQDGGLYYFMEMETYEMIPGVRGGTAQGGTKPARLVTGAVVQVPLFIEIGDVIRVDRTVDKYITRVSS
jgi:elongation factor P